MGTLRFKYSLDRIRLLSQQQLTMTTRYQQGQKRSKDVLKHARHNSMSFQMMNMQQGERVVSSA
jgi:hypothetical protein